MEKVSCENCFYCLGVELTKKNFIFVCKRFPPISNSATVISKNDWCGEFKSLEGKK